MNRSSSPIQSINWDDHNDTSRYVMRSLYMYFMLILVPRQCSWCGNLLAHWKRKKCLLHVHSLLDVLTRWHGKETVFISKLLTSDDTCRPQVMYRDSPGVFEELEERRKKRQRTNLLNAD